ncbi:hypothetical protein [Mucilaginibacter sp. L3T2-6]|uniref:hypothetical protein n=1 Tax=Mucilaginibacter sp. L3T2-6 TaxID=3062491 RepID=UPI002675BE80|nr:hypothetical protein [Mucilaginibacter sp. L3T2-6]MDO3641835.1 hypothetical protein [Mucilaginibacter sp. L3T2-6]MDV6214487.1 hypothetical protein [Mucilaginibacter sp. L3T2-6]
MNTIEEKLWSYIDGTCTPEDMQNISRLIASDESVRLKYQELLAFDKEFAAMELDEPSMAFTYNVIEAIRTQEAMVPLKTRVNKRIILGIVLFFVVSLTGFLVYALSQMDISSAKVPDIVSKVSVNVKLPQVNTHISKPLVEGFMFFDVVLGLYLFDKYLRRKNAGQLLSKK